MTGSTEKTITNSEWADLGRGPLFVTAPPYGARVALSVSNGRIIAKAIEPSATVVVSPSNLPADAVPMSEATGQAMLAALAGVASAIGAASDTSADATLFALLRAALVGTDPSTPSSPAPSGMLALDLSQISFQ